MKKFAFKFISFLLALTLASSIVSCNKTNFTDQTNADDEILYANESLISIVPQPKEVSIEGDNSKYVIYKLKPAITTDVDEFTQYASTFAYYASKINGITFESDNGGIKLVRDTALLAGQYRIVCQKDGITVSASDNDGITYALATLHQIIQYENGVLSVPSYTILDQPDCSYRALMVDLARQWHSPDQVKDYIDLCYLYKIKFIHLHFTDNESYTLPSEALPSLTTPNRSYSKQDIADLNQYCLERNIEIIPEIDMPGHASCFTSAYPKLFKHTGVSAADAGKVLCVGKTSLMENLKTLVTELITMFPSSRYIHVGGDEADFSHCNTCIECQKYMAQLGITDVKSLYTKFIKDITDMVIELGKTPVVWEGFPKEGAETISRDIVVTAWESLYHLPNDLINEGFTVANSSWQPLYIVPPTHAQVQGGRWQPMYILRNWNIYTWRNWWSASAAYAQPIEVKPTDQVIGGTLCAWECTYNQDIIPIKENLAAVSEKLWNVNGKITYGLYLNSLDRLWAIADKVISD